MKFKLIIFIICLNILNLSNSAFAKFKNNIVLKVESEIISNFEIKNKIMSSLILSNQVISQDNIDKIKKQSINSLIEQKLKIIELSKYNFKDDSIQLESYLRSISSNNIKGLKNTFEKNGVDFELLLNEIKIEMKWQKLIYQMYSDNIQIDENMIDQEVKSFLKNRTDVEEFDISEIEIFSTNDGTDEEKILFITNKIKDIGFKNTAIKYSTSSTASNGGNLGWLSSKSLTENIYQKINKLEIGDISDPINKDKSIVFLKLNNKKISKIESLDLAKLKKNLINNKKNELFQLYSQSFLSKLKNTSLIEYQ
tara:strand:+ start:3790 stop:4719 length:930 start_codon:yes stop_codon:yes gene_type:complete